MKTLAITVEVTVADDVDSDILAEAVFDYLGADEIDGLPDIEYVESYGVKVLS
jgi:hypothetical protein